MPEESLKEGPRIVAKVKYYSCFMSYGEPDLRFAKKLTKDLRAKGVSCWLWDTDKTVGQRTQHEIEEKLEEYEKIVVLCSIHSLLGNGIRSEIYRQLAKDPDKLVPVSLEEGWKHDNNKVDCLGTDLKPFLVERNYADFANKRYEEALAELLKGLRRHRRGKRGRREGGAGMANPKHLALVRKGAAAIAEWRREHPNERLDLSKADLSGADLSGANLSGADLSSADLSSADLSSADLSSADLSSADLSGANLSGADLRWANLSGANLSEGDLRWANLSEGDLSRANLSRANLGGALLAFTFLGDTDLSQASGLEAARHAKPSHVGADTLIASFRGAGNKLTPQLRNFLRGAGVPQELLDALPAIVAEVRYYSCFVSYGQPDLESARKLWEGLEARGVSCWLYEMDKTVGKLTWGEIEDKLDEYDRIVVLCSIEALIRDGFKKEVDKQIDKNPDKLVPVSLENRWTQRGFKAEWADRDLKTWLLDRNYADFANKSYEEALEELLKGLRRPGVRKARKKKG